MANQSSYSTKLDAEKRLALQEEKQAIETKLLEVCVIFFFLHESQRIKGDTNGHIVAARR